MKMNIPSKTIRTIGSILLSLLMLGIGLDFMLHEGVKLGQVKETLVKVTPGWLYLGMAFSLAYIWLHGLMYRQSFRVLGIQVSTGSMVKLFLKRNFVSVFLPAGFLSSQAFFSQEVIRTERVKERELFAASGIFVTAGLLSAILLVVPALGWLLTQHILPNGAIEAFLSVSVFFFGILWAIWSFIKQGKVYHWCQKYLPGLARRLDALDWSHFDLRFFIQTVLLSCLVELTGVFHVFIAARALGVEASVAMAFAGYLAVLVVLLTSPFLRGVGAVEALMAVVLAHFGLSPLAAVSVAVLFRFFEFWLTLLLAIPTFIFRPQSLMVRLAPSFLLFSLGVINIFSSLTPSLPHRLALLGNYLPLQAIHASVALTVVTGVILLLTAFYLYRGLKSAWWLAMGMALISLLSHLIKGFDYEEAILALLSIGILLYQRDQYNVPNDLSWMRRSRVPALVVVTTLLVLGTLGFYWLDHQHFGADFSWVQSAVYALRSFLLIDVPNLHPLTKFGAEFLAIMHLLGGLTFLLLVYTIFRPLLPQLENPEWAKAKARQLIQEYGKSSLDYFKIYADKKLFFPKNERSFIAYKNTSRYALVLDNPVAPDEQTIAESISEFDRFCQRNGLRSMYYRLPEASVGIYRSLGKIVLPIGQEAILPLTEFSLEGRDKKALRNAVNRVEREGFVFVVHEAPQSNRLLQQLRAVSDEWLKMYKRAEMNFSQGSFDENELKNQVLLTLEDAEGKVYAFINLIPGANPQEANFDLMRRTQDAPSGTMDFMFVKMFLYLQSRGYTACNLGLVPMSGLEQGKTMPEKVLNQAYTHLPQFANFKSLRFFKDKFNPVWETRYVACNSQLDVLNLPLALDQVERRVKKAS